MDLRRVLAERAHALQDVGARLADARGRAVGAGERLQPGDAFGEGDQGGGDGGLERGGRRRRHRGAHGSVFGQVLADSAGQGVGERVALHVRGDRQTLEEVGGGELPAGVRREQLAE